MGPPLRTLRHRLRRRNDSASKLGQAADGAAAGDDPGLDRPAGRDEPQPAPVDVEHRRCDVGPVPGGHRHVEDGRLVEDLGDAVVPTPAVAHGPTAGVSRSGA
jgi:hypothetical protein